MVETARDAIREGESIAGPLKRSGEFPPLVHHMIAIGERSGQLEEMLFNVADSYENQVSVRIGALTALMEPLIIVAMGVAVAFVAFSILMPILQLNTADPMNPPSSSFERWITRADRGDGARRGGGAARAGHRLLRARRQARALHPQIRPVAEEVTP